MTLAELKKRAEKATPGPWWVDSDPYNADERYLSVSAGTPRKADRICTMFFGERPDDAEYIAACSPERIQALIEVAEKAKDVAPAPRDGQTLTEPMRRLMNSLSSLDSVMGVDA